MPTAARAYSAGAVLNNVHVSVHRHGNPTIRPTRRQKEDLAMALRLLSRSAAALVAEQLGPAAQRLPSDWNPFASLAGGQEFLQPLPGKNPHT